MSTIILCGGIGSGKSTLAKILLIHGFSVIELDQLARSYFLSDDGRDLYQRLLLCCELSEEESKDASILRQAIFNHEQAKTLLQTEFLPILKELIDKALSQMNDQTPKVLVFPIWPEELLGIYKFYSQTIVLLSCDVSVQTKRLLERDRQKKRSSLDLILMGNRWLEGIKEKATLTYDNSGALDGLIDFALSLKEKIR